MDNVNIPAVAEGIIDGAIHNDIHNIFEQTLFAPGFHGFHSTLQSR